MKVKCVSNMGNYSALTLPADKSKQLSEYNYVTSHEWFTIDGNNSGYILTVDGYYNVFGVLISNNEIRYLIFDDNNLPQFFPSELFVEIDDILPYDCHIYKFNTLEKDIILIGCSGLNNYKYLVDLIDLVPSAVTQVLNYRQYLLEMNIL